ncbi:hypothetical protein COLO4_15279 [Corchorus olitorius]|uniref:Uncharacterized protein n=1 Tax=Corchorus olitorius TaxID=93759 RepID=A0A1R3JP16_9ROSI|nr:hypothetical protein COLO4_15279 [Corchorus olitorius]
MSPLSAAAAASSPSFLLRPNSLKFKQYFPLHLPSPSLPRLSKSTGALTLRSHGSANKFNVKCFLLPEDRKQSCFHNSNRLSLSSNDKNPFEIMAETMLKALNALKKPAMAAVLLGLLLMYNPNNPNNAALAASGGRMGGRSFSSSSRRSSSSSSRSGGSSSRSSGGGSSYSRSSSSSTSSGESRELSDEELKAIGKFVKVVFAGLLGLMLLAILGEMLSSLQRTSVIKLQVGLSGMARSLQRELNRIAEDADTSTSKGLSYVLTETAVALLRHPEYCISAYSSVNVKYSMDGGEKHFNQLSIEERAKFDEETLVNVDNVRRKNKASQKPSGFSNEYLVVTILVAAEGEHKLPPINGSKDLKEALQKLASITTSKTLAVEVLWTPQDENDTLSEKELLEDYPELRPL